MNVEIRPIKTAAERAPWAESFAATKGALPGGRAVAMLREEAFGRVRAARLAEPADGGLEIHRPARRFARCLAARGGARCGRQGARGARRRALGRARGAPQSCSWTARSRPSCPISPISSLDSASAPWQRRWPRASRWSPPISARWRPARISRLRSIPPSWATVPSSGSPRVRPWRVRSIW